jgi:hypothetical protein
MSAGLRQRILNNGQLHMQYAKPFETLFEQPLDDFWIDNVKGFDAQGFSDEILNATSGSLIAAVRQEYDADAATLVSKLVPRGTVITRQRAA